MNVAIYTTQEQTEQPAVVHHVTTLSLVDGLLTIECDVQERGHVFSGFHRFERSEWTRFEVGNHG